MTATRHCLLALRLGLLGTCAAANAVADPVSAFGLGGRSPAMGGAVTADVSDFSAAYYNPSGLVREREMQLTLGFSHLMPKLERDGADSGVDDASAFSGGLVAPGTVLTLPVSVGLAFHVSTDHLSRVETFAPEEPRFILYDNRLSQTYFDLALALRPTRWLLIGGGMAFHAGSHGRFDVGGNWAQADPYQSQLSHQIDAQIDTVDHALVGLTLLPSSQLSFGLVYREQARVDLDLQGELGGDVDFGALSVPARYTLESHTVNAFVPRQLVGGASWRPTPQLALNLDLSWQDWSSYQSPLAVGSSELEVSGGASALLNLPEGSQSPVRPARFVDRWLPRVGAEYTLQVDSDWSLPVRAGYAFQSSPVPEQQAQTAFLDADAHLLSIGAGAHSKDPGQVLWGSVRLDLYVLMSLLASRRVHSDVTGSSHDASGQVLGAGATLGVAMH